MGAERLADADALSAMLDTAGARQRLVKSYQRKIEERGSILDDILNRYEQDITDFPVPSEQIGGLVRRMADGTLSSKTAKEAFEAMVAGEGDADAVIAKRGLRQISDAGALESAVDQVLGANPQLVADYRAGKQKAFNALVGQVMKATQGRANPAQVNEILRRRLA